MAEGADERIDLRLAGIGQYQTNGHAEYGVLDGTDRPTGTDFHVRLSKCVEEYMHPWWSDGLGALSAPTGEHLGAKILERPRDDRRSHTPRELEQPAQIVQGQ